MKKIFMTLVGGLFAAATALAGPIYSDPFKVTQPDGTVLTLRAMGDEHHSFYLEVNTGQRFLRDDNGNYYLPEPARYQEMLDNAKVRRATIEAARAERQASIRRASNACTDPAALTSAPTKAIGQFKGTLVGDRRGLVILVNFADRACQPDCQEYWDRAFNEHGFNGKNESCFVGSVNDFFSDQSYGQLNLTFDVVGPVTVSQPMKYYGGNNSYGNDLRPGHMIVEACQLVDEEVDFSKYDWDGDGEVDQVFVIYAGHKEKYGNYSEPNAIWPHEYQLIYTQYGKKIRLDNTYINTYACAAELAFGAPGSIYEGIGTACHEFAHCVGYPDLYDTDYSGGFGMSFMSILDSGNYNGPEMRGEVPCGFSAYERWMAGWIQPTVLNEGCHIDALKPLNDRPAEGEPVAYVVYNDNKGTAGNPIDEYFILENRQCRDWFRYVREYTAGHGLYVFHVDYNKTAWTMNEPNNDPTHQRFSIIPAAGRFGQLYGTTWYPTQGDFQSMPFPGTADITELTNGSHYDCGGKLFNRNTDGTFNMNKPITDIRESAQGYISFDFLGGKDTGERWTVTYNAGDGTVSTTEWTQNSVREATTIPAATPADPKYRFMGWSLYEVEPTYTRPADLIMAGATYQPEADVVLYAVYGWNTEGDIKDEYRLTTSPLKNGMEYLFVSKSAPYDDEIVALSTKGLLTDNPQTKVYGEPVDVDFSGSAPTIVEPKKDRIWTVAVKDDQLTITSSNNGKILALNENGLYLTTQPTILAWSTQYGLSGKASTGQNYYVHHSDGSFYVSSRTSSTSRFYAYEKSDYSDKPIIYATNTALINPAGISTATATTDDAPIYDLSGRRVTTTAPGLYIRGGKKVMR